MKDFVRPAGRLRTLPLAARATYSVFLVFTLLALGFTAWLGADMLRPDLREFDAYYAGAAEGGGPEHTEPNRGPQLDLPDEALAPATRDPIPLRKLLEVTHFHLFSMPVYLVILSHLFMLSRRSNRAKLLWIGLGTLGVLLHIAAPWWAQCGGAAAKLFYAVSGSLLALSFLVMALVPLFEMWLPARAASER